nr:hypothetical protein CFP56_20292 [Quercus suber]
MEGLVRVVFEQGFAITSKAGNNTRQRGASRVIAVMSKNMSTVVPLGYAKSLSRECHRRGHLKDDRRALGPHTYTVCMLQPYRRA